MMMNKTIFLLFVCSSLIFSLARAQQTQFDKQRIQQSSEYYWGESSSQNEQEANSNALKQLMQSIAVTVSSSFEKQVDEHEGTVQEKVKEILNSYSNATLKNIHTEKSQDEGAINVFLYIAKQEVEKVFDERRKLIQNIFSKANEFEQRFQYSEALKYYYFALVLLNSVPSQIVELNGANLVTEIPLHINALIGAVNFSISDDKKISDKEREITVAVAVHDSLLQSVEFSFWDGANQVTVRATDGEASFRLIGSSVQFTQLEVNIRYNYYESREEIKEVAQLWDAVLKPTFRNTKSFPLQIQKKNSIKSLLPNRFFTNLSIEN